MERNTPPWPSTACQRDWFQDGQILTRACVWHIHSLAVILPCSKMLGMHDCVHHVCLCVRVSVCACYL